MSKSPSARAVSAPPKRAIMPIVIPALVILCTLVLVAGSAWPVLRPSRTIEIAQAVLVENSSPAIGSNPDEANKVPAKSTRTVQAAGWLEAEPFLVAATALADGVLEEMLVLEGDHVEQGQVIARLIDDDAKLRHASDQAELAFAKASLADAQAQLVAAESNWESPYELERAVTSTQAKLEERQAELVQLPSLIKVEEALLVLANEEKENLERAFANEAAAQIEYIERRERANAQAARVESLRQREPILRSAIALIESDLHAAQRALELRIDDRARLDSARAGLELAKARVAQRQAKLDESALELERVAIRAPITGFVQRRLKLPGDKVIRMMDAEHSAHILHLYDPSKIQVRVDVPLADASQVVVGQRCEVIVEVLSDRTFVGEVLRITHEADLQKNTLQVKVRVLDPDPILRPEMLTRVKFVGSSDSPSGNGSAAKEPEAVTVRIPEQSIDGSDNQQQVWLITDRSNGRGVLQPVSVNTQSTDEGWATVTGSLLPGSMIAADPNGCVAGEQVKVQTSIQSASQSTAQTPNGGAS